MHDFPDEAKFLSEDDRRRVIRRLKLDQQSSAEHEEFKLDYLWASLKDWKTYTGMMIYMGCDGAVTLNLPMSPVVYVTRLQVHYMRSVCFYQLSFNRWVTRVRALNF